MNPGVSPRFSSPTTTINTVDQTDLTGRLTMLIPTFRSTFVTLAVAAIFAATPDVIPPPAASDVVVHRKSVQQHVPAAAQGGGLDPNRCKQLILV
ncbi:MAG: hypothetical protein ACT4RN_19430 [Pseudonocardia sp.]